MHGLILLALLFPAAAGARDAHADAKRMIAAQCAACHIVPGVPRAKGNVGPSLKGIAKQQIIAGKLPNGRGNMIRWLMHPQQIVPGNAMPEMGLSPDQAGRIADYLFTLDER